MSSTESYGLQIIDVTDPTTASLIGTLDTAGSAVDVILSPNKQYAYVADSSEGLQTLDISAPVDFSVIYSLDSTRSIQTGMLVFGDGIIPGTMAEVSLDQHSITLSQAATDVLVGAELHISEVRVCSKCNDSGDRNSNSNK